MKKYLCVLIIFLTIILEIGFINSVKAETLIYDNITSSNYKFLKINTDTMNIGYINDYQYEIYINGNFTGYFKKGENVFYPDNSNITIFVPSPIKTDVNDIYSTVIKPILITVMGFLFTWGLIIIIVIIIILKLEKDYRR